MFKDAFQIRDARTNKLLATATTRENAEFARDIIAQETADAIFTGLQGSGKRPKLNVVQNHNPQEVDR